jgi:hypothetical protein
MKSVIAMLAAVMLFSPARGLADTTGALNGTVSDSANGAPLANVVVIVNSPQEREQAKTDPHGSYVFIDLRPGVYTVTAVGAGYNPYASRAVVHSGSETTLKIALVRMLKTIVSDCFCPQLLMQPGVTADEYRIRRGDAPSFDFVDLALPLLWTVPGITFGRGPRAMR